MFKLVAMALIGMQAVDSFLTMWAINTQGAIEANPLMASIAHTWMSPLVKIVPVIIVVALLAVPAVQNNRKFRLASIAGMVAGVAFLALVTCLNVGELL